MPKMKTNRAAAKRFRKTASGKFKCGHAFRSHILTKKSTKRKRGLRAINHVRRKTPVASPACCRTHKEDGTWHG